VTDASVTDASVTLFRSPCSVTETGRLRAGSGWAEVDRVAVS